MGASKDRIKPVSTWCKYFFDRAISPQTIMLSDYPLVLQSYFGYNI